MKKILKGLLVLVIALIVVVGSYLAYLQVTYYRIPDHIELTVNNAKSEVFEPGEEYKITTYNIGFGAYEPSYSFFMDTAVVKDTGEELSGAYGKAISKENVLKNTDTALEILKENSSDIYLLQEVDRDSSRSYQVNQEEMVTDTFGDYSSSYAENFHAKFLPYPLHDMHGYVNSGIMTLSDKLITSAERRSYPITTAFFAKFFDLDRCFSVSRFPVGDKELIVVNNHMSAYDEGGVIRKQQVEMLNQFMNEEYEKGNYVIVGGDFNHDYTGTIDLIPGNKEFPGWLSRISNEDIAEGLSFVTPENFDKIGSCRGAETPFNKDSFQCTVDGFIISDNIKATAEIIDTQFSASDHNPVSLTFELQP